MLHATSHACSCSICCDPSGIHLSSTRLQDCKTAASIKTGQLTASTPGGKTAAAVRECMAGQATQAARHTGQLHTACTMPPQPNTPPAANKPRLFRKRFKKRDATTMHITTAIAPTSRAQLLARLYRIQQKSMRPSAACSCTCCHLLVSAALVHSSQRCNLSYAHSRSLQPPCWCCTCGTHIHTQPHTQSATFTLSRLIMYHSKGWRNQGPFVAWLAELLIGLAGSAHVLEG